MCDKWLIFFSVKPGKGKGKTKETTANSTTAGSGVTVLSEKKLFLGQKVSSITLLIDSELKRVKTFQQNMFYMETFLAQKIETYDGTTS